MKDDLKIFKVEYLSNNLLNHTQILNLILDDQTIVYKSLKWRRPLMEDDLKIIKVEYLSHHLLDHTQTLNLCLDYQILKMETTSNERRPHMQRWPHIVMSS